MDLLLAPASREQTVTFTPPGSPRTYQIAVLGIRERLRARADVIAEAGTYPADAELYAEMRAILTEAEPANLPDLLALIETAQARPLEPEEETDLRRIEAACQAAPRYNALIARRERHMAAIPLVYFLHAVRGWEGEGLPDFARRGGLVQEHLLAEIPDGEMALVGWRAQELAQPRAIEAPAALPPVDGSRRDALPALTKPRRKASPRKPTSAKQKV